MRFSIAAFFVAAVATVVSAQSPQPSGANPFKIPPSGLSFSAGQPATISWTPTSSGTVTILLREGSSGALASGTPIAREYIPLVVHGNGLNITQVADRYPVENIDNSGSFTWTPPSDIVRGSDYALEIIDDTNPNNINYTPQFSIDSSNTVSSTASATSSQSSSASSASASTTSSSSSSSNSSSSSTSSSSSASTKASTTLATKTTQAGSTAQATSSPSAGAAAPVMKVSGGLVVLALGMMAL